MQLGSSGGSVMCGTIILLPWSQGFSSSTMDATGVEVPHTNKKNEKCSASALQKGKCSAVSRKHNCRFTRSAVGN